MNDFQEEQFADTLEALLQNKRLPNEKLTPELSMAIRLKTSQQRPQLRRDLDRFTEKLLLKEFALPQRKSFWQKFWQPIAVGVAMGAVLLAVTAPVLLQKPTPQTLAEVQDFESLSTAEKLLGSLPADAVTSDGVEIADLRTALHEINLERQSADTTLDPDSSTFPHVELRNTALDLIEKEEELDSKLPSNLIAMVDMPNTINTFAGKVSGWPTTNEGVDFETHSKAVNTFLTHATDWDNAMTQIAQNLVLDLK